MRTSTTILAAAGLATAASSSNNCTEGLYMIVARGTGEPAGTGSMGVVANDVADQIPNSKVVAVDYAATFNDYLMSEYDGAKDLETLVTNYHTDCPNGKMALFGYSQGAQLTSDAICGGSEASFNNVTALPSSLVKDYIVAIVLYGDPSHIANTTYDKGTSVHNGIFPRTNTTVCTSYTPELVSYCDAGDIYCDSGSNDTVHHLYVDRYGKESVQFVVDRYNNATSSNSTGTSTSTATGTSAAPTASGTGSGSGSGSGSSTASGSGSAASGTPTASGSAAGSTSTGAAAPGKMPEVVMVVGASLFGLGLSWL